jgi:hypothetical protein
MSETVNAPDPPFPDVWTALQQRQTDFLAALAQPSRYKRFRMHLFRRSHPELLKVYGIIYNHLIEIQRLMALRRADPPAGFDAVEKQIKHVLEKDYEDVRTLNIHAAWELAASLERMLLLLGDANYIRTRLEGEREKVEKSAPGAWSQYLPIESLTGLLDEYKQAVTPELGRRAVEHLAFLYAARSAYLRTQRAREELRADYLNRLTAVLALLLLLLLEGMYLATNQAAVARFAQSIWSTLGDVFTLNFRLDLSDQIIRSAIVAALTGAFGSTLSGFYKLRDEAGGIPALRAFRSAMWAQPFVGASVGILLMLLIRSGVIALSTQAGAPAASTDQTWMSLGVFCFLAGFSEPFFLGVVQRVAGAADKKGAPAGAEQKKPTTP